MKPSFLLLLWLLCCASISYATHLKGAELTAQRTSPAALTYTFTLTLYEDVRGVVTTAAILSLGDGSELNLVLQSDTIISDNLAGKVFTGTYTYAAPGTYRVSYNGSNRNPAVNIENAVDTPLNIELSLLINQSLGVNNLPVFKKPPQFFAKVGEKFTDDYIAADAEGDSLVYSLVTPISVVNYVNPAQVGSASNSSFTIDARSGLISWDTPRYIGNYVFAVKVEEWRQGVRIGTIMRDIQLTVTSDNPNDLPPGNPVGGNPPQEPAAGKQFLLFPNPASGRVFIQLPDSENVQSVQIWSPKGQFLKTKQLDIVEQVHSLDLQELPRGIYLINIRTVTGHFTRKLVVMH